MQRSIIIDGEASDWYEKATFVLKSNVKPELPQDLTRYAEDVLEENIKLGKCKERMEQDSYRAYTPNVHVSKHNRRIGLYIDVFCVVSVTMLVIIILMQFT